MNRTRYIDEFKNIHYIAEELGRGGQGVVFRTKDEDTVIKIALKNNNQINDTKEIEEFINLTITEHMGKEYADWKLSQPSVTGPDEVEEEYKKVIATLPQKQEEAITKYCDQIFNSGAETEEFFYRLGLRDGMKLRKNVKMVLKQLSE